jgi:AraC-like DNA-binding protein
MPEAPRFLLDCPRLRLAEKISLAMDVLADLLEALRMRGTVYCRSELGTGWALHFEAARCATFHVMESGSGWLSLPGGGAPRPLAAGDMIVLPSGAAHVISDQPARAVVASIRLDAQIDACLNQRFHDGIAESVLICGTLDFAPRAAATLLKMLPGCLHVRASGHMLAALNFLAQEAGAARPGSGTILRRLADVLFIQALRAWLEEDVDGEGGWLRALRDPQIGAALALMHGEPGGDWTVARLARQVAMSRSAFAERFTLLVGQPPMDYLNAWRMQRAAQLLEDDALTMAEIASAVGYQTTPAFSRAFKRRLGANPSAYRRAERGNASSA